MKQKRDAVEGLLSTGETVTLCLDARRELVVVPPHLENDYNLALNVGYNLPLPIADLKTDEHGIQGTFSFNRRPEWVFVPWAALWGASCRLGKVLWPADMPAELRAAAPGAPPAGRVTPMLPPAPDAGGSNVIDLMSRRSPKDRHQVAIRLGWATKLTAPNDAPGGGSAA